ncbi:MAG: NnrS family protein [Proteobacteria bacterium]|nr:NnrS family protein [Pseudomonadota bacterium]NOG59537.1 NnrS family protein [Pseudomonadota bacterium]
MSIAISTVNRSMFDAPIWSSAFRPFFLAAAIYGPLVMLCWLAKTLGIIVFPWHGFSSSVWHGHELLIGFGSALVSGFLLTAIPSWAETFAVVKGRLALLAGVWLAARIAILCAPVIPSVLIIILDLAFFPLFAALLLPSLLAAEKKYFLAVLIILAGFFYGNLLFYTSIQAGDERGAAIGLRFFLYTLITLYTFVGGFLTPIFTENALRGKGWDGTISFHRGIETLAIITIVFYGLTGIYLPGTLWSSIAGLAVILVHGLRMSRWQTFQAVNIPIVAVMHFSYLWFLISVILRVLSDSGMAVPELASVHAFTVGAFGMMKIGLLCRVALRHTGRQLIPPQLMIAGFVLLFFAALLRVIGAFIPVDLLAITAAIFWLLPFLFYLWCHGSMLLKPSLPK